MNNIEKIKKLKLDNTEIIEISYIKDNSFVDGNGQKYDNLPRFLRVVLKSTPSKSSLIMTELWLPDEWNGIFLGTGNGGMAGNINYWNLISNVRKGYAVANTDMGTSQGRNAGINNSEMWKDFGWRATHIMTVISKAVLREYYGEKEKYSYFIGESTGGQQALSEAQRFPEDYDGIVAGVPANNRLFLHTYFLWNHNHLTTRDGKVMFDDNEIETITKCAVKYFQFNGDGENGDTFISFPYLDANTIDGFIDYLKEENPKFSINQIEVLRLIYNGPVNSVTGEKIYNGMPIGSEIFGCGIKECQGEESPHFYPFIWAFGEGYDGYNFDFADDLEELDCVLGKDLNANNDDLELFEKNGGKLIAYSASADPCVPFPDAMNYYNRVCQKMGGYQAVSSFFKYYLIPGRDHGRGGMGANELWDNDENKGDVLEIIRAWREDGIDPNCIIAARVEYNDDNREIVFARNLLSYRGDKRPGESMPEVCSQRY